MASGGIYTVSVKQTDIIMAESPVHNLWLPMSNLDLLIPPLHAGVFFCYKKPNTHEFSINLIKKSLALALVPFYPLAGEVVQTSQGEPEILCNNRGVEFIHACADLELKYLDIGHPDDVVEQKLLPINTKFILSIQATEFICGGLVIGCSFDHRVADAHSMYMFLISWANITQSKSVSCIPSFRRSTLNPRRPLLINPFYNNMYIPFSSLPKTHSSTLITNPLISRIYYVKAEDITNLQKDSSLKGNPQSKLMSFISFIWKIIAKADQDSRTCRIGVVVDGRERVGDDGMRNYFGNVLSVPSGEVSSGCINEMTLGEVGKMVEKIVSSATTDEHFRGLVDWVEARRPETSVLKIYTPIGNPYGDAVVVSSGLRFKMETIDFGWGKPVFGSFCFPWGGQTGYVMPLSSATKNGDWIVYMHLLQKHLDLVDTEGKKVFTPLTPTYLEF